jgi:hypothetical protein
MKYTVWTYKTLGEIKKGYSTCSPEKREWCINQKYCFDRCDDQTNGKYFKRCHAVEITICRSKLLKSSAQPHKITRKKKGEK